MGLARDVGEMKGILTLFLHYVYMHREDLSSLSDRDIRDIIRVRKFSCPPLCSCVFLIYSEFVFACLCDMASKQSNIIPKDLQDASMRHSNNTDC